MNPELIYVTVVLAAMLLLFATEKLRMDVVAVLAMLALALPGIITPGEAIAGFSDQSVVMIAALFVVGGAIMRTGLADSLGSRLQTVAGTSYLRMLVLVMAATALLSAFLSSTGTVAVMLPVVVSLARRAGISPSKLLLPMAYAALLGGTVTLIATPPNLIVSSELAASGFEPFSFFDFSGPGLVVLVVGTAYMAFVGRHLLPERIPAGADREAPDTAELWERYGLTDRLVELRVEADSKLAGQTIAAGGIRRRFGVSVLAVRTGAVTRNAQPDSLLAPGDLLTVKGEPEAVRVLAGSQGLSVTRGQAPLPPGLLLAEVLVSPRSRLHGQSVAESGFRSQFGADIVGMRRGDTVPDGRISQARLQTGDALLLMGSGKRLSKLQGPNRDMVFVTETRELAESRFRRRKAPVAVAILSLMLLVMAFGLVPNVLAVLLAALACVLTGCIEMDEAYRDINWTSVIMIAGILPVAAALERTGVLALLVSGLGSVLDGAAAPLVLAALFLLTALIGLLISNTATAVLIAPVAIQVAGGLGLDARAAAMVVALACSAAFVTPVSSPVNTLVLASGGYRFGDFVKVGLPLLLLMMLVTVLVVPWFFPLTPPV